MTADRGAARRPGGRGSRAPASLSPSRAGDFLTCPLLYRFRVDRPAARAAQPGRHPRHGGARRAGAAVRPPGASSAPRSRPTTWCAPSGSGCSRPSPSWPSCSTRPTRTPATPVTPLADAWLQSAGDLLDAYFALEDPTRLEPAERELFVEHDLESGLRLRGYVDRLDVAPTGDLRVVDYKTGRAPREGFEAKAMFQMRFYALVLWRLRGGCRGCCSCSTSAAARCCATSPTRPTCWPPSASWRRSGRPSAGHRARRLAAQPRAGCATGATTRRCARPSAAPRPTSRRCEVPTVPCRVPRRAAVPVTGARRLRAPLPAHARRRDLTPRHAVPLSGQRFRPAQGHPEMCRTPRGTDPEKGGCAASACLR